MRPIDPCFTPLVSSSMSSLDGALRWREDGGLKPVDVETQRIRSELLTAESQRLILESDRVSKRMQQDANKKLAQRDREIQFLRQELEQKLKEVIEETDVLVSYKRRVEMSLEACKEPLTVTMTCLGERLKRAPVDRVQDEVERHLLQEREVIEGAASLLQRTLEQISEQLRLNRSARYHVEKDLKDKFTAQCIDDACSLMRNHSTGSDHKSKHPDVILPSMVIIPEEWESFSGINMSKAEREKVNSVSLRALVDSLLEQTATDMKKQLQATDSAFRLKVLETKTVKMQMEEHLDMILSELGSQEKNMESLQTAVAEEQKPLQVAQARLSARGRRPGTELCHDPAQSRLLSEVQQLTAHINRMCEALLQSETEQKKLIRCQLNLQENIDIKANSLYIDEVICTQLREPIVIHSF